MFRGELSQGGYRGARTFVRGILLLLLGALIHLSGARPGDAATAGCIAVSGGAFNLNAAAGTDDSIAAGAGLTFAFQAGDTLTFTTTGNPVLTQINVGGTNLAVAGNTAQFVFPASGSFLVTATLNSQAGVASAMTVVCQATTDVLKTLTDPLRNVDLNQQRHLLRQINDTFLQGTTVALQIAQLEARLAPLLSRLNELERLIAQITAERRRLTLAIRDAENAIKILERSRPKKSGGIYDQIPGQDQSRHTGRLSRTERWLSRKNTKAGEVNARQERFENWPGLYLIKASFAKPANKNVSIWPWRNAPLNAETAGTNYDTYHAQAAPIIAKNLKIDKQIKNLRIKIVALQQSLDDTGPAYNAYVNERKRLLRPVSRIQGALTGLRARVGQSAPFAATNLQAAMELTSVMASDPYRTNPLRLQSSGRNLSFFTDLKTLRRQAAAQARLQQARGPGPDGLIDAGTAALLDPAYNIWAKGSFTDFGGNQAGADRDGRSTSFATGAYVAPSARFMFGAMYRYRNARSASTAQASTLEVIGHGAGAYSTLVLSPKLSLSGHVLYEKSQSDVTTGITTGSFDGDQITLAGQLRGSFWRGPLWLRPGLGVTYSHAERDSYTDSFGVRISGQTSKRGQLTFGPRIGYRVWRNGKRIKFIEPSLSATGIWTFEDEGNTTIASGTLIEQDNVAARFSAGLSILLRNDNQFTFNAGYAGLGESEVNSYSVGGQITIPLGRR